MWYLASDGRGELFAIPCEVPMRGVIRLWCASALVLGLSTCGEDDPEVPPPGAQPDAAVQNPLSDAGAPVVAAPDAAVVQADAGSLVPLDAGALPQPDAEAGVSLPQDTGVPVSNEASVPVGDSGGPSAGPFALTSSVVKEGELIAATYRCAVPSPPLAWSAGPSATQSYAIVFKDEGNGFNHWLIYDIPKSELSLPMGVMIAPAPAQPSGAKQGPNYAQTRGYGGPCGGTSTYTFTLYALDVATLPGLSASSSATQIISAIEAHDLATTKLSIKSMR